jgi:hypothetical protein
MRKRKPDTLKFAEAELAAHGVAYRAEPRGPSHWRLSFAGFELTISSSTERRAALNARADVRRKLRELGEGQAHELR